MKKKTVLTRKGSCFVVVSYEGCWRGPTCDTPHYLVDCEIHGHLARVGSETTARFIMAGHKDTPTWPKAVHPVTEGVIERIHAARTGQDGRIFLP